jgi:CheY-like chemotaxis protein/HPt (histidine-containing phosphotransfer) domain-containing protein
MIIKEASRLVHLINDLLDLSKLEKGKVDLDYMSFSIRSMLDVLNSSMLIKAKQKDLNFSIEIDENIPTYLHGDPYRIQQVLVNLVGNAIKFTKEGFVKIKVSIQNTNDNKHTILFEVLDSGIGIADDKKNIIFDDFIQVDNSITKTYGGTGLGISISKQLVKLMDGEIGIDSKLGSGCRFWFTLELEEKSTSDFKIHDDDSNIETNFDFQNRKVLIVDDYETNQLIAQSFLLESNCRIEIAKNGIEAVEIFRTSNCDLILMDLHMPKMDGCEATKLIRQTPEGKDIPIFGVTADGYSESIAKCKNVGMNDVITKPFRRYSLLKTIAKELGLDPVAKKPNPQPEDEKSSKDPIDLQKVVEEFMGKKELAFSVIEKFLKNLEAQIPAIEKAISENDLERIKKEAHKIYGGASNLIVQTLAKDAKDLETDAKSGITEHFKDQIQSLIKHFDELKTFIKKQSLG